MAKSGIDDVQRLSSRLRRLQHFRLVLLAAIATSFLLLLVRLIQHGLCQVEKVNNRQGSDDTEFEAPTSASAVSADPERALGDCLARPASGSMDAQLETCKRLAHANQLRLQRLRIDARAAALNCMHRNFGDGGIDAAALRKCPYPASGSEPTELATVGRDALALQAQILLINGRLEELQAVKKDARSSPMWCSIGADIAPAEGKDSALLGASRPETLGLVSLLLTLVALIVLLIARWTQASHANEKLLSLGADPTAAVRPLGSGDTADDLAALEKLTRTSSVDNRISRYKQYLKHLQRTRDLSEQLCNDVTSETQEQFQFHRDRVAELEALDDEQHPIPKQIRRDGEGNLTPVLIVFGFAFAFTVLCIAALIVSIGISGEVFTAVSTFAGGCAAAAYGLLGRHSGDEIEVLDALKTVSTAKAYLGASATN